MRWFLNWWQGLTQREAAAAVAKRAERVATFKELAEAWDDAGEDDPWAGLQWTPEQIARFTADHERIAKFNGMRGEGEKLDILMAPDWAEHTWGDPQC